MGFEAIKKHLKKADQPTIFVFPGIHENNSEVKELGANLSLKNNDNRLIFTWNGWKESPCSLENFAGKIMNIASPIIKGTKPYQPYPIWLIGYSFGCSIAVEMATLLKKYGFDPHLILIDGVAPELAYDYFTIFNPGMIEDIILLINYAAKMCNLQEKNFSIEEKNALFKLYSEAFSAEEKQIYEKLCHEDLNNKDKMILQQKLRQSIVKNLHHLTSIFNLFDNILTAVAKVNNFQKKENQNLFQDCAERVKNNLAYMLTPNSNQVKEKIKKINVLMTNETLNKYSKALSIPSNMNHQLQYGGWEEYAEQISSWDQYKDKQGSVNEITSLSHVELMKKENVNKLTDLLSHTIQQEVSETLVGQLLAKSVNYTLEMVKARLEEYRNAHPQAQIDESVLKPYHYSFSSSNEISNPPTPPSSTSSGSTGSSGSSSGSGSELHSPQSEMMDCSESDVINEKLILPADKLPTKAQAHKVRFFSPRSTDALRGKILRSPPKSPQI